MWGNGNKKAKTAVTGSSSFSAWLWSSQALPSSHAFIGPDRPLDPEGDAGGHPVRVHLPLHRAPTRPSLPTPTVSSQSSWSDPLPAPCSLTKPAMIASLLAGRRQRSLCLYSHSGKGPLEGQGSGNSRGKGVAAQWPVEGSQAQACRCQFSLCPGFCSWS